MTQRKLSLLVLLAAAIAAPLWAGTYSAAAFKRLQSLAGEWEGKDGHGMPAKTTFKVLASGTAVMETLSPSGMEDMVTLYSIPFTASTATASPLSIIAPPTTSRACA